MLGNTVFKQVFLVQNVGIKQIGDIGIESEHGRPAVEEPVTNRPGSRPFGDMGLPQSVGLGGQRGPVDHETSGGGGSLEETGYAPGT